MVPMISDDGLPPSPTGRVENLALDGMLLMWSAGQPVLLRVAGTKGHRIPIFTTIETLKRASHELTLRYESVKQITDGRQFFDDMKAQNVRIIVDPHIGPNGKARYLDIHAMGQTRPTGEA